MAIGIFFSLIKKYFIEVWIFLFAASFIRNRNKIMKYLLIAFKCRFC